MTAKNRVIVHCQRCSKTFETIPSKQRKYCSFDCYWGSRVEIHCEECGKAFTVVQSRKTARFCSQACQGKAKSKFFKAEAVPWYKGGPIKVMCHYCGKTLYRPKCQVRQCKNSYCSAECQGKERAGKSCEGHICTYAYCEICGDPYLTSRDNSKYCSHSCYGKARSLIYIGEKCPSWRGGLTTENNKARGSAEYTEWRKRVYRHDGWQCQVCGKKPREIIAHHIFSFKEYPEIRYETWNGITMCRSCHAKEHHALKKPLDNPSPRV